MMLDPDLLAGRLFLAVGIPAPTRAPLEAVLPELQRALPAARIPTPSGWHVTCAFLGRVRPESAADVTAVADAAAAAARPVSLRLEGAGGFPTPGRARALWTGLAGDVDVLRALADDLADRCRAAGLRAEDRPFQPHLTIARLSTPTALPQPAMDTVAAAAGAAPGFQARTLTCYRSHVTNKGARYEVVREFPLGGAGHTGREPAGQRGEEEDEPPLSPDPPRDVEPNRRS